MQQGVGKACAHFFAHFHFGNDDLVRADAFQNHFMFKVFGLCDDLFDADFLAGERAQNACFQVACDADNDDVEVFDAESAQSAFVGDVGDDGVRGVLVRFRDDLFFYIDGKDFLAFSNKVFATVEPNLPSPITANC